MCWRFLVACVVCMLPDLEGGLRIPSQRSLDAMDVTTSPTRLSISTRQDKYELRVYSLEEATMIWERVLILIWMLMKSTISCGLHKNTDHLISKFAPSDPVGPADVEVDLITNSSENIEVDVPVSIQEQSSNSPIQNEQLDSYIKETMSIEKEE
ncbi:hypothetical protein MA16_Dca026880 [Dendrobium catenatum]|uniref:Uncharacterized protein n=1 Tax=Dendrobium catenatum TaxID=906689 RepID=A0A2I0W605_9ASPA|nr:hypothetical protein MA16_Dca026880 [Dendrobium catenatum]